MKITENVLTQRQISNIYKTISQTFSEGIYNELTVDIARLKSEINKIVAEMKLTEVFHSSDGSHKGWKIDNLNPRKRNMAARGYLLIFKFREFLLNEKINYRYYYEDNQGVSRVTTFDEDNIAKYMKFGPQGIQINPAAAREADVANDYNDMINHFFNKYTSPDANNYMKVGNNTYGRVVRSNIMAQYSGSNPGLMQKNGKYQLFNKGHIYEAIDTSISAIIMSNEPVGDIESTMDNYVFGRYLALDNIRASQGGDNLLTNTSIKSGGADLYDFYTIKQQLEQIREILKGGLQSKKTIATEIEKMFLHSSKFNSKKDMQAAASKAAQKLIDTIQSQVDNFGKK